ncbi:MAG TPA: hypothetical protein VKU87_11170, partial [Thermomicrobiaceae bacterium]|nr:hypothetical protein [Thermomicrobiaceae bacterium]
MSRLRRRSARSVSLLLVVMLASACVLTRQATPTATPTATTASTSQTSTPVATSAASEAGIHKIKHVVVIMQE